MDRGRRGIGWACSDANELLSGSCVRRLQARVLGVSSTIGPTRPRQILLPRRAPFLPPNGNRRAASNGFSLRRLRERASRDGGLLSRHPESRRFRTSSVHEPKPPYPRSVISDGGLRGFTGTLGEADPGHATSSFESYPRLCLPRDRSKHCDPCLFEPPTPRSDEARRVVARARHASIRLPDGVVCFRETPRRHDTLVAVAAANSRATRAVTCPLPGIRNRTSGRAGGLTAYEGRVRQGG